MSPVRDTDEIFIMVITFRSCKDYTPYCIVILRCYGNFSLDNNDQNAAGMHGALTQDTPL
jgi:hypothetical protein